MNTQKPIHTLSLALTAAALASLAPHNQTHAQDLPPVNDGFLSIDADAKVLSEYWYRGIGQQNKGLIAQPTLQLNVEMGYLAGMEVTGYLSSRNVFIDRTPGGTAAGTSNWYESDNRVGAKIEVLPELTVDLAYGGRYAPSRGGSIAEEVTLGLRYDDTGLIQVMDVPLSFQPHLLLAQEINGHSDLGGKRGTYLELGLEPGMIFAEDSDFPVNLSLPLTVGLSLNDYYEDIDNRENNFGFVDIGARVGTEMPFIPREFGQWHAYAGLHAIWLGSSAQSISNQVGTGSSGFHSYGLIGIGMTY